MKPVWVVALSLASGITGATLTNVVRDHRGDGRGPPFLASTDAGTQDDGGVDAGAPLPEGFIPPFTGERGTQFAPASLPLDMQANPLPVLPDLWSPKCRNRCTWARHQVLDPCRFPATAQAPSCHPAMRWVAACVWTCECPPQQRPQTEKTAEGYVVASWIPTPGKCQDLAPRAREPELVVTATVGQTEGLPAWVVPK